jgi:hypothetical protein
MTDTQVAYSNEQYPARHEYMCIMCGCRKRYYEADRPALRVMCPGCKSEMVLQNSTAPVDSRVPIDNRYRAQQEYGNPNRPHAKTDDEHQPANR